MRPPGRTPYALAVALVVSATTVTPASVESNIRTRRPTMSLTRTRPLGRCRTELTAPRVSFDTATTGPSWRIGGSDCAPATEVLRARTRTGSFMAASEEELSITNNDYLTTTTAAGSTAAGRRGEDAAAGE